MPYPLEGSLNALNAPPPPRPLGLTVGGPGRDPTPTPRELTLNEIIGKLAGMAGQTTDIPRQMAYNLGPALVGKAGQGPQTGAELFGRLGLNPNSPAQRAIGHGGGAALDMLANPINLLTMGAGRAAPAAADAAAGGSLARRLEQFAGPGLGDTLSGASSLHGARPVAGNIPLMEAAGGNRALSPFAGRQLMSAAEIAAERAARGPRPAAPPPITPGVPDFETLRVQQLNSPEFDPTRMATTTGLGTPAFTQNPIAPPPTATSRLDRLVGAARAPAAGEGGLVRQLEQMADPVRANVENFNSGGLARPANPEAALGPALPSPPRGEFGPPMFPQGLNAAPGGMPLPVPRPEYGPDQFRAFYQAMQNPGRGQTLGPRSPTTPEIARLAQQLRPPDVPLGARGGLLPNDVTGQQFVNAQPRTGTTPSPRGPTLPDMSPIQGPMAPPAPGVSSAPPPLNMLGRNDYTPEQYAAMWQAIRNPGLPGTGRGPTLPPGRGPTLTNGPIDY